jgi:titin
MSKVRRNRSALTAAAAAAAPVVESMEERVLFNTYIVSNTYNSGSGSLRDAIYKANAHSGADTIQFKIGSGLKTIAPTSSLPAVTGATYIDGTTQGGYAGKPLIELRGNSGGGGNGLLLTGGSSTVKGLIINRFSSCGILIINHGGDTIKNCYLGTDSSGRYDYGNGAKGIVVQASNNTIGGTYSSDRNVISGNGCGIQLYTSAASYNKILGNYIGTDYTGTKAIPNSTDGIAIRSAAHNTIGGTTSGARNVISGNGTDGIVCNGSGANYNTILGNYIGTNASGTARLGNNNYGVEISEAHNTVGGTTAGSRNVISGNKYSGVVLWLASGSDNKVIGNYIGTDYSGKYDLGNYWRGVEITNGSSHNYVGGYSSAERNVMSGNESDGVRVYQGSDNWIIGNYIGFGSDGYTSRGNTGDGIRLPSANSVHIDNNKIGNNSGAGVNATTSSSCSMSGNTISNDSLVNIRNY